MEIEFLREELWIVSDNAKKCGFQFEVRLIKMVRIFSKSVHFSQVLARIIG